MLQLGFPSFCHHDGQRAAIDHGSIQRHEGGGRLRQSAIDGDHSRLRVYGLREYAEFGRSPKQPISAPSSIGYGSRNSQRSLLANPGFKASKKKPWPKPGRASTARRLCARIIRLAVEACVSIFQSARPASIQPWLMLVSLNR